jgi:acetyl esterase/lipase
MVICPGGGYVSHAPHEGRDYARWLNEQGIAAFVLQYRLGTARHERQGGYRHPAMLQDAARAVRTVRSRAGEWGIDPRRIGHERSGGGSTVGGHLAATLLTHFDAGDPSAGDPIERESSRPDRGVLCYPVITMGEQGHAGCRQSLLGDAPSPELVRLLSNELQVTSETPPTFLFHTVEDTGVPVQNSLLVAAALAAHGVPFALHVYPRGAHGIGLGTREWDPAARHPWTTQCALWLQEQEFAR